MSTEPTSLLADLRAATRAAHERAELLVGLPQTLDAHIQTLTLFYGFIEPWEADVSPYLAPIAEQLQGRRKASLLLDDLTHLGVSEHLLTSIPRCEHLPHSHDRPTALGSMYVFEGSTLGGQILSRQVEQRFGLTNGNGYSFYRSYGPNVGIMWRQFCQILTQNTPSDASDALIASANETFHRLCDWFETQR